LLVLKLVKGSRKKSDKLKKREKKWQPKQKKRKKWQPKQKKRKKWQPKKKGKNGQPKKRLFTRCPVYNLRSDYSHAAPFKLYQVGSVRSRGHLPFKIHYVGFRAFKSPFY